MRFVLALALLYGTASAQTLPTLAQFLSLTSTQIQSIQQLNNALNQFTQPKNNRLAVLQQELNVENAKSSPDPLALGQRYLEIDSINREVAAQEADTRAKIAAQLTARQIGLLGQISTAVTDAALLDDARCGYLADRLTIPVFAGAVVNSTPILSTSLLLLNSRLDIGCSSSYPISIRSYLALTDPQVSGILALRSGFSVFQTQKANRTADVQVELRDQLEKPVLDPLALGVRYVELSEISQELTAADKTTRASARSLLMPSQQSKLQALVDESSLTGYSYLAQTCHLLTGPSGAPLFYFSSGSCRLN